MQSSGKKRAKNSTTNSSLLFPPNHCFPPKKNPQNLSWLNPHSFRLGLSHKFDTDQWHLVLRNQRIIGKTKPLTQKNLYQFPPVRVLWSAWWGWQKWGSWRRMRRRREGSQREERPAQKRGDPQGKGRGEGKKLYSWKRADDIQEGHGVRKMSREIERFVEGGRADFEKHSLISFPSLKCFLHKAQTTKTWRGSRIYRLNMKECSFQSCID